MTDKFTVKIYTPAGPVAEATTSELTFETASGQVTLLPAHCSYTTMLGAGVLRFQSNDGERYEMVTSGGFCNFLEDEVLLLTDSVDYAEDVSVEELIKETEEISKKLAKADFNDPEARYLQEKLNRARALQDLVSH